MTERQKTQTERTKKESERERERESDRKTQLTCGLSMETDPAVRMREGTLNCHGQSKHTEC